MFVIILMTLVLVCFGVTAALIYNEDYQNYRRVSFGTMFSVSGLSALICGALATFILCSSFLIIGNSFIDFKVKSESYPIVYIGYNESKNLYLIQYKDSDGVEHQYRTDLSRPDTTLVSSDSKTISFDTEGSSKTGFVHTHVTISLPEGVIQEEVENED